MFQRKLKALSCPFAAGFDCQDESKVRNLVVWLEDQVIRHYKIEDRQGLRSVDNPQAWNSAFQKYAKDLGCPHNMNDINGVIDWMLGLAIRCVYQDEGEKVKELTGEKVSEMRALSSPISTTQLTPDNPLDRLSFEDPEFKKGIEDLAKLLNVPNHPDHIILLKGVSKLIQDRLNAKTLDSSKKAKKEGVPMSIENLHLGFDAGDYVLNNAAKVLRLLHVDELRRLQTSINETIVKVQNLTADPKTDDRLGKVGRM